MKNTADKTLRQLGWYVRNCAFGPMAGQLEHVLLQFDRIRRAFEEEDEPNFSDDEEDEVDSAPARSRRCRLRELHRFLKNFAGLPRSQDDAECNVRFARDEFGLDWIDTEILLLIIRYGRNGYLEQFADKV